MIVYHTSWLSKDLRSKREKDLQCDKMLWLTKILWQNRNGKKLMRTLMGENDEIRWYADVKEEWWRRNNEGENLEEKWWDDMQTKEEWWRRNIEGERNDEMLCRGEGEGCSPLAQSRPHLIHVAKINEMMEVRNDRKNCARGASHLTWDANYTEAENFAICPIFVQNNHCKVIMHDNLAWWPKKSLHMAGEGRQESLGALD